MDHVEQYTRIAGDPEFSRAMELAENRWVKLEEFGYLNFVFEKKEFWFKFPIKNTSSEPKNWVFGVNYPFYSNLYYRVYHGEKLVEEVRHRDSRDSNIAVGGFSAFHTMKVPAQTEYWVYLKMTPVKMLVNIPLVSLEEAAFRIWLDLDNMFIAAMLGAIIVLCSVHIVMFLKTGSATSRSYVLFQLAMSGYFFIYVGAARRFLVYLGIELDVSYFVRACWTLICIAIVLSAVFIRDYFGLRNNLLMSRINNRLVPAGLIAALACIFLPIELGIGVAMASVSYAGFLTVYYTIKGFGTNYSMTFGLALAGFISAILAVLLPGLGGPALGPNIGNQLQFSVIWQALFVTLAIGDKMNAINHAQDLINGVLAGKLPETRLNGIEADPVTRSLIARDQLVSVMFIDIVSFSVMSKKRTNSELFHLLSARLIGLRKVIKDNDGEVDRSLGDGILCFFEGKEDGVSCAEKALRAAVTIQEQTLKEFKPH